MNPIFKILSNLGNHVTSRIWRLGSATRLFLLTLIYSGESFRRIHLTIREIYFTGVMSLIIIVVVKGLSSIIRTGSRHPLPVVA